MKYDKSLLEVMQWKQELGELLNRLTLAERLAFFQSPANPGTEPSQVGKTPGIPDLPTQSIPG
jgi:hypothetical protein